MARHRNVRAMNIDEEYEGYYDCYGHSVEDDFCISPGTEAEFLYDRNAKKHSMSAFLNPNAEDVLHEEEESGEDSPHRSRTDSLNGHQPKLSSLDKAKLQSCIEGMQNVVGDTISETTLSKAALDHNFNMEKALNAVLSGYDPKPQRLRRDRRKEFYVQTEYDFSIPTEYDNFHNVYFEDSILWCCSLSSVFDSATVDFTDGFKTTVQNSCVLYSQNSCVLYSSSSLLLWIIMMHCKDPTNVIISSASCVQKNQNSNAFHSTSKSSTIKAKTQKKVVDNVYELCSPSCFSSNPLKPTVRASKLHSFPCTGRNFSYKPSFMKEIYLYCRQLSKTLEDVIKHIFDMSSSLGKQYSLGSFAKSNNKTQKSHLTYLNLFLELLNKVSVHPFSKLVAETEAEILLKLCDCSFLRECQQCFLSNLVVHCNKLYDRSKGHDSLVFIKELTYFLSRLQSFVHNSEFSELYLNCLTESLYSSFVNGKTKRKHFCHVKNKVIMLQDLNIFPHLHNRKCCTEKITCKPVMNPNKIWVNNTKRLEKCIRTFFTNHNALLIGNEVFCTCKKYKFQNHYFNHINSYKNRNCIHSLSFITTVFICKQIICSLHAKDASNVLPETEFYQSNNINMNETKLPYTLQDCKCRNCGKVDFSLVNYLSNKGFVIKHSKPSRKKFNTRNKRLHIYKAKNNMMHDDVTVNHSSISSDSLVEAVPQHSANNILSDSENMYSTSAEILPVHSDYVSQKLNENPFEQCKNCNIKSRTSENSILNISDLNANCEASNVKLPETTLCLDESSLISVENQGERNCLLNSSDSFEKTDSLNINDILNGLQKCSSVNRKSAKNCDTMPSNPKHDLHLDFLNNDNLSVLIYSGNEINDKVQFKDKCIGMNNSKINVESSNETEYQSFESGKPLQEDLKSIESNFFSFALNDSPSKETTASIMEADDVVDDHLLTSLLDNPLTSVNYKISNNSPTELVLHSDSSNDRLLSDFESMYFGPDKTDLSQISVKNCETYSVRDQGKENTESDNINCKNLLISTCNNGETDSESTNKINISKEDAFSKFLKHSNKYNELGCQKDGLSKNISNLFYSPDTSNFGTKNMILNQSLSQANSNEVLSDVPNAIKENSSLKDIINNFDVTAHSSSSLKQDQHLRNYLSSDSTIHHLQQVYEDVNTDKFDFSPPEDMSLLNIIDIDSTSDAFDSLLSSYQYDKQTTQNATSDLNPKSLKFLAHKYLKNSDVIISDNERQLSDLCQNSTETLSKCESSDREMKSENETSSNNDQKLLKEFSLADLYFSSQCEIHSDKSFEAQNIYENNDLSMKLLGSDVTEPKHEVYNDEPHSAHVIDLTTAKKASQDRMECFNINFVSRKSASSDFSKNATSDHVNAKNILISDDIKSRNVLEKVQPSLFAKVLCSKYKPQRNLFLPKPPKSLKEILSSIRFFGKFSFNTPSPDDVAAEKQRKAFRTSGTTDKNDDLSKPPPTPGDVKDSSSVAQSGRLEFNTDETSPVDVDNLKKTSLSKESSPENKEIQAEEESPQELSGNSAEVNGTEDDGGKTSFNDREQEKSILKTDEVNTISGESTPKPKNRNTEKDLLEAYKKERAGEKPLINLVVIGHVDAGKSTLMGHLLFRLGCVAKRTMHKYEQDSKKLGKASFMYAWVLDETSEERTRGITMDVAQSKFDTPHRSVTLLDAPGHKDFIPNMITGAAQADVAVLVVDATRGEFETGFETGGQTREHTLLVRSLGVSQLSVAVNKLDNVNWDQERYKEIVSKLSSFLKQAGFKESDVQFVPCSGLTGENLMNAPQTPMLKSWYTGPCLVDAIDNFKPPERPVSKPFRLCIGDVFKGMGGGFCVSGRIEAGFVQNADRVLVMPAGEQAVVKGITIDEASVTHAFAGDHVTLQLAGVDINKVNSGSVVCDTNQPVKVTTRFQARLVIFNIDVPITKGFPVILHYQSMSEQAIVHKLISQLHRSTGQVVKKKPRCLTKNSSAVIEVEVIRPICVELYKDFKDLGRFMLRSGGSTIAAGLVTEIL